MKSNLFPYGRIFRAYFFRAHWVLWALQTFQLIWVLWIWVLLALEVFPRIFRVIRVFQLFWTLQVRAALVYSVLVFRPSSLTFARIPSTPSSSNTRSDLFPVSSLTIPSFFDLLECTFLIHNLTVSNTLFKRGITPNTLPRALGQLRVLKIRIL